MAVYSYRLPQGVAPVLPAVYASALLWKLTVMKSALTAGRWPEIDCRPLEFELTHPVEYFMRDQATGQYSIYRSDDGQIRPSSLAECSGLEAAAVWDAEHVESRLRDCFAGRSNAWVEQLKPSA